MKKPKVRDSGGKIARAADDLKIHEEIQNIHRKIDNIKQINNYNSYNIAIVGPDMYKRLIDKVGEREALSIINQSAIMDNPLLIFDKLYLTGVEPNEFPIAYHNGEYRFLNRDNQVVVDRTGNLVYELIASPIQDLMLQNINNLIDTHLEQGNCEPLYDTYQIGQMQGTIFSTLKKETIVRKLEKMVKNKSHPFFRDEPSFHFLS
jgi:hypothetical protein